MTIRLILYGIIALAVLIGGYLLLDRLIWAPIRAATERATTHGHEVLNKADTGAASGAIPIVAAHGQKEATTNTITRDHYVYITKQPGANDPVSSEVWGAYVSSLCMRSSAAGVAGCGSVQPVHP